MFDGRNKLYGGYELRVNYPRRLRLALLILGIIGLSTAVYAAIAKKKTTDERKVLMGGCEIQITDPLEIICPKENIELPKMKSASVKPTVKHVSITTNDELKNKAIGTTTKDGDVDGLDPALADNKGGGNGNGTATGAFDGSVNEVAIVLESVEQMPEPSVNLNEFLQRNLRYPALAKDNSIEGRVIVRFVVNEDGMVSNAEVVRGIGGGCDEEAMRVLMKMPVWKAGRQNGKPVKVYFTLPIYFKLG